MRRICCALGLLVSLTLTGCGESGPVLVEAGGKVTYNNAPIANATVRFLPADGSNKDSPFGMGTTDKDGNFELKVRGDKGVPEGTYDVTVTKLEGADTVAAPTSTDPSSPDMMKMMAEAAERSKNQGMNAQPEKPKTLIPLKYNEVATSGFKFTIKKGDPNNKKLDLPLAD